MVLFDTSVLVLAFDDKAYAPLDPDTGVALVNSMERINHLIETLSIKKERILIPTPVISEYLVRAGPDKDKRLAELTSSRAFSIGSFDQRAAVECALLQDQDTAKGSLADEVLTKAKVKFDRQIIAIAKAHGAEVIYTGDNTLAKCAKRNGIATVMTWEIPLPTPAAQASLDFSNPENITIKGSW